MVVSDVAEVVATETEGEEEAVAVVEETRFDRIKATYKGFTSAIDLSGEDAAYEDFASLLGDQKVRTLPIAGISSP